MHQIALTPTASAPCLGPSRPSLSRLRRPHAGTLGDDAGGAADLGSGFAEPSAAFSGAARLWVALGAASGPTTSSAYSYAAQVTERL